jgi:RHS repeat-associated protein
MQRPSLGESLLQSHVLLWEPCLLSLFTLRRSGAERASPPAIQPVWSLATNARQPVRYGPDPPAATPCLRRHRPHRRNSHLGCRRFSGQTRGGRYSWARYYHPSLQRFISEDPIGFTGGDVNLYAYVRNNAVNRRDPLGLATAGFGGTIQGGILARVGFYSQGAVVVDTKGNVALTVTKLSSGSSLGFQGVTTCIVCISGRAAFQVSPDAADVHALAAFRDSGVGP